MLKLAVSFLVLQVVSADGNRVGLPNPFSFRCDQYDILPWDPSCLSPGDQWYVAASTNAGARFSWKEPNIIKCDSTFTSSSQYCGLCTFIEFYENPDYPGTWYMIETALNESTGDYDRTISVIAQAYSGIDIEKSIFRCYRKRVPVPNLLEYSDAVDERLSSIPKYKDDSDLTYSFGVIYCTESILVIVFCNQFEYLTYNGAPNVLVLSKNPYISWNDRQKIFSVLKNNKINPNSLYFRNNYNCPKIDPYIPDWSLC